MRPFLHAVATGPKSNRDLTYEEAQGAMELILSGGATPVQAGVFLIAQRNKGESPEELHGFADALRAHATILRPRVEGLVDVGSPYDGRVESLVVSPFASLLACAAGTPIVMHGNRDMPPKHGITVGQILDALGVPTELPPKEAQRSLEEDGFAYLYQPHFVPVLEGLRPVREQVTLRTAFNTIEKIYDLASAPYHIIGLTHTPYLHRFLGVMGRLGFRRSLIIQGIEGTEDAGTHRPFRLIELRGEEVEERRFNPVEYGLRPVTPEELKGGGPQASVAKLLPVLEGRERGPLHDLVALNAALRIYLGDRASDVHGGLVLARQAIDSGAAFGKLQALRARAAAISAVPEASSAG